MMTDNSKSIAKTLRDLAAATSLAVCSTTAGAATVLDSWTFNLLDQSKYTTDSDGNRTYTVTGNNTLETLTMTLSAWQVDGAANSDENDFLVNWGSGLGIDNPGENVPWHGIDNLDKEEFVSFDFGDHDVAFHDFNINYAAEQYPEYEHVPVYEDVSTVRCKHDWHHRAGHPPDNCRWGTWIDTDRVLTGYDLEPTGDFGIDYDKADVSVAYNPGDDAAASDLAGDSLTDLGFQMLGNFLDVDEDDNTNAVAVNAANAAAGGSHAPTAGVWVLGAGLASLATVPSFFSDGSDGGILDDFADAFKLKSITVKKFVKIPPPPTGVPVPATLALFGLGLLSMRRKFRASATA